MTTDILFQLEEITDKLGGNLSKVATLDHSGRTSEKIIIEYNIKQKEEK